MIKIDALGKIEGGKLIIHGRKRFEEDLRQARDCEIILVIKKRGKVSSPQRGYYFGVIVQEIRLRLKELGHRMTNEEVHELLKLKFHPRMIADENGEVIAAIPGTTTEFNISEMSEYMQSIIEWAAEALDCHIPPADKTLTMDL